MKTLHEVKDEECAKMTGDLKFEDCNFNYTQLRLIDSIVIAYAEEVLREAAERAKTTTIVDKQSILSIIEEINKP